MWGYSPEHGQLTCGHSPKKNDSPSHRNYQLPITALVEVGLFSFALAAAGILTGLILSVQINTVVMYPGRRAPCHIQKIAPHRTLPIIWMYTCPQLLWCFLSLEGTQTKISYLRLNTCNHLFLAHWPVRNLRINHDCWTKKFLWPSRN